MDDSKTGNRIFTGSTIVLCAMVLIAVCVCMKMSISHQPIESMEARENSSQEMVDDISSEKNSLVANIATVAKLDSAGGWTNLSVEEKKEVLETICRIECRYLGMWDTVPSIEFERLKDEEAGYYNSEMDKVIISYKDIEDEKDGYSACQIIIHELYHRYEQYQVNLLKEIRTNADLEKYAGLLILDNASIYEKEMDHYIIPDENEESSYQEYFSQKMEVDAEQHANWAIGEYKERIQNYFETNE